MRGDDFTGSRPQCWAIPSERIVALAWCRAQEPAGWLALWLKLAKAWRA